MIRPPKALDYPDRPLECQEAISGSICDIADQALAMGWGHQEVTEAIMEIANAWYFTKLENARTEQAIDLACAPIERGKE